jgi:hypothetical protein
VLGALLDNPTAVRTFSVLAMPASTVVRSKFRVCYSNRCQRSFQAISDSALSLARRAPGPTMSTTPKTQEAIGEQGFSRT